MLFTLRMLLLCVHFVVASLVGLLISVLRPFNPDNTRLAARIYALPALRIMGVEVHMDAAEVLDHRRPAVIVANHVSNYDLFVLGPAVPHRTVTVGKKSLKWVPLFGQLYWLAGNVLLDRGNAVQAKRAMMTTTDTMRHHDTSIWMFPEGTRGHGKGLQPLKRGAFQMAVNAGVPVVPLCVNNYVRGLHLNKWRAGRIEIRALPPIPTEGMGQGDIAELIGGCHAQMLACVDELDRLAGTVSRT
ncbi:MAG: 1-acylglycerol-3-phosphate O-acyltransferase [Aquabacterium sp.]